MNERQLREMLAARAPVGAPPELVAMIEAIPATAAIPTTSPWLPAWRPQRRVLVVGLAVLVLLASLATLVIGSQLIARPPSLPGNGVIIVPTSGPLLVVDPVTGEVVTSGDPRAAGDLAMRGLGLFGTNNSVAWAPDGRSLAGFNRGDLHVIDVGTGQIRTIAKLQGCQLSVNPCDLAYSPDGASIAVTNDGRLHLVDVATGAVKHVRTYDGGIGSPTWSPDGRQIAVSAGGSFEILDLTGAIVAGPFKSETQFGVWGLSWSPDGSRVGYLRLEGGDENNPSDIQLVTVRPDGTDERAIANIGACFCLGWGPPGFTWSPDGHRLAFVTLNFPTNGPVKDPGGNADGQLYVANADGSHIRLLTSGIPGGNPAWQPLP